MSRSILGNRLAICATWCAAAIAMVVLYAHDPATHSFYPRCMFHALTGLQCPGCGATRALFQLLHGNVGGAFRFNALFVVTSPALAFGAVSESMARWSGRTMNLARCPWVSWSIALIVIAWGVLRNF